MLSPFFFLFPAGRISLTPVKILFLGFTQFYSYTVPYFRSKLIGPFIPSFNFIFGTSFYFTLFILLRLFYLIYFTPFILPYLSYFIYSSLFITLFIYSSFLFDIFHFIYRLFGPFPCLKFKLRLLRLPRPFLLCLILDKLIHIPIEKVYWSFE